MTAGKEVGTMDRKLAERRFRIIASMARILERCLERVRMEGDEYWILEFGLAAEVMDDLACSLAMELGLKGDGAIATKAGGNGSK